MKTIYWITSLAFIAFSCVNHDTPKPVTDYIKAEINGVNTIYTSPANQDLYNYIKPGAINITFKKNLTSSQYWSIDIIYGNVTLDITKLPVPFTIIGPNPDNNTGELPEFHTNIIDPDSAPYGKLIAEGTTFNEAFTLVITSTKDNIIKGTFEGKGNFGTFSKGEFSAKLPTEKW